MWCLLLGARPGWNTALLFGTTPLPFFRLGVPLAALRQDWELTGQCCDMRNSSKPQSSLQPDQVLCGGAQSDLTGEGKWRHACDGWFFFSNFDQYWETQWKGHPATAEGNSGLQHQRKPQVKPHQPVNRERARFSCGWGNESWPFISLVCLH